MKKICGTLLALTMTATSYASIADFSGKSNFVADGPKAQKCEVRVWPVGRGEHGLSITKTLENGETQRELLYGELRESGSQATINSVSKDRNYPEVLIRKLAVFSVDTSKQGFARFKVSVRTVVKSKFDLEPFENTLIECAQLRQEVSYGRYHAKPMKD